MSEDRVRNVVFCTLGKVILAFRIIKLCSVVPLGVSGERTQVVCAGSLDYTSEVSYEGLHLTCWCRMFFWRGHGRVHRLSLPKE
jgi:hypothetical protein